jgi:hypothetical protein
VVVRQGDAADSMYVLRSGQVRTRDAFVVQLTHDSPAAILKEECSPVCSRLARNFGWMQASFFSLAASPSSGVRAD